MGKFSKTSINYIFDLHSLDYSEAITKLLKIDFPRYYRLFKAYDDWKSKWLTSATYPGTLDHYIDKLRTKLLPKFIPWLHYTIYIRGNARPTIL